MDAAEELLWQATRNVHHSGLHNIVPAPRGSDFHLLYRDIIDKTALPGKYKAWIYQYNSSLASTCVRRAINISGIDGTIDQCTLEDGSRFSEASAALLSTSREQSCNYWCMTSVFKKIKVTKFRQFLMMRDSSDAKVRKARASRRTGRSQPRRQYERQSGDTVGKCMWQ